MFHLPLKLFLLLLYPCQDKAPTTPPTQSEVQTVTQQPRRRCRCETHVVDLPTVHSEIRVLSRPGSRFPPGWWSCSCFSCDALPANRKDFVQFPGTTWSKEGEFEACAEMPWIGISCHQCMGSFKVYRKDHQFPDFHNEKYFHRKLNPVRYICRDCFRL